MSIIRYISHFLPIVNGVKAKYKGWLEINSFLLVINSIILLISCQTATETEAKKVFRFNSENGISSLDPAYARTQENIRAVNQLFNGLVQLDSNLKLKACIAKSWEVSEGGKLYTFHLRNDVLFHKHPIFKSEQERRLTAFDVEYSLERIIAAETASDGAWIFNGILDSPDGFKAINDTTFTIHLNQSFAPLINMLSMAYCFIVPKKAVLEMGKEFAKSPIGTGPFQFANWKEGVRLNFTKNDEYFEASPKNPIPYIDAISISFVESKQTALLQLIQGQLDAFSGLESSFKDELLNSEGGLNSKYSSQFKLIKTPFLNTEYLAFNLEDPNSPYLDSNLRYAIHYAIDRKSMIYYLRNNVGIAADGGFVPKGLPSHLSFSESVYMPDKAMVYANRLNQDQKKLKLTTTKDYLDLCVLVQNDLKKVGIELAIDVVPSSLLKQQKSSGDVMFFRSSWIADYPDGENYMACFYSKNKAPNGPNYTRFSNSEFDALYERLIQSNQETERIEIIHRMEQILHRNLPYVLLFYDESIWICSNKIAGMKINPLNYLDLRYTRISE